MREIARAEPAMLPSGRGRIDRCLAIEGMTSAGGLALMDLFVARSVQHHDDGMLIEFGAYKGRSAALLAHHGAEQRPLLLVEQTDHLQVERLREISTHIAWHQGKSEPFCTDGLDAALGGRQIIASHHDASHFFDNVETELAHVAARMHRSGVIVLGDFSDTCSQVRAAYYFLRYAMGLPFEALLIGFNKCVLVHESAFARYEKFVLYDLLWDLKRYRIDAVLSRTDVHQRSRAFHVRLRTDPSEEAHYGTRFWGDRFYRPDGTAAQVRDEKDPSLHYGPADGGQAWRMLSGGPVELYFVGASVTAQRDSWADRFAELARARTGHAHALQKNAMGGVGLLFGVANYSPPVAGGPPRLVLVEFSTGDLNLGLTPLDRLGPWLEHLVQRARADGAHVVIVHNWRDDFDVEDKPGIRRTYDELATRFGLPVIANHRLAAALIASDSAAKDRYFRDVCHTTADGAALFAEHALRCLEVMAARGERSEPARVPPPARLEHPIQFVDLPYEALAAAGLPSSTYTYPTSQQAFKVLALEHTRTLSLSITGTLLGVAFLSGPRTGWVDLLIDGKAVVRFRCFDRNSHYERYILLPAVFELSHSQVQLRCADADVDFAIVARPHPDFALPRLMKVVQLAGIGLQVHDWRVEESP